MSPEVDPTTGRIHYSFFREFSTWTDTYLFLIEIEDEEPVDFRITKHEWTDLTEYYRSRK